MAEHFPGSMHVLNLNLEFKSDRQIFDFAGKNDFTIVTKDKDFYHLVNTIGPPPKVIWLSLGNCSNQNLLSILLKNSKAVLEFIKSNRSLFVISSHRKS